MNITSLPIPFDESNTLSYVSVAVPSILIHGPAIEFWITVVTEEGLIQESKHHIIGVKPYYAFSGSFEMNAVSVMAQGKTLRPSVNVLNTAVGPVYGTINLLVDGRTVYSESGVFEPGTMIKEVEW